MKIERFDGTYVVSCTFAERRIPRLAGFFFSGKRKRWVTTDDSVADILYDYTVGNARQRLDNIKSVKEAAVAASYAEDSDEDFPSPDGLSYLGYQKAGISYALARKDTLIADKPGLGKTIQAIGVSNATKKTKKTLIIPPAGLLKNWAKEFAKWTVHDYSIGVAQSRQRSKKQPDGTTKNWIEYAWPDTDVVLINYEMLPQFHDNLREEEWSLLVCDESHMLQNAKTIRTRHVLGGGRGKKKIDPIPAEKRIFLSGTPITNKPVNIWTVVHAFDPHKMGADYLKFVYRYCDAVKTPFGLDVAGASNLEELRHNLRTSFMIRRSKEAVLKELPPKRRQILELPAAGLRRVVKKELQVFEENLARLEAFNKGEKYKPEKVLKDLDPGEVAELMNDMFADNEMTGDFTEDVSSLSASFSYHFEAMSLVREETAMAKIPMAKDYIDRILETGEKVIIFVVHKTAANELRKHYPDCAFVTGAVPKNKRQDQVDKFQEEDDCRVFIGNISAAGVGYTLTAATHVVFVEFCWVWGELEQAEDRAHRIGQLNAVNCHFLVVEGSLEAYMIDAIIDKMKVIEEALDG